jgi:dephospho-CoA kinase
MLILGLTGSIGMGKSETARMFIRRGIPVYDADAAVHRLYEKGGAAVGPVGAAFPGTVKDGAIDRVALGAAVIGKPEAMARLEALVHPLLGAERRDWLEAQDKAGAPIVVLDIPLLYETGGEAGVDLVVVVSAPEAVQRARVLERPTMTAERLEAILAKQMPDAEKCRRADFVLDTGRGLAETEAAVDRLLDSLKTRPGKVWAARLTRP